MWEIKLEVEMDDVNAMIAAIGNAVENKQSCPRCGAPITVAGATKRGDVYAHPCDCLMMMVMERDYETIAEALLDSVSLHEESQSELREQTYDQKTGSNLQPNNIYTSHCHNCKKSDGIDNSLPECTEDPPYKYRCKYCTHSLRTDKRYGQGKEFDMAMLNRTWTFDQNGNPITIHCSIEKKGKNIVY